MIPSPSKQQRFIEAAIRNAKAGDGSSLQVLRSVLMEAAHRAPGYDIVALAECVAHLGREARQRAIEKN